jgi:hypothetical protein
VIPEKLFWLLSIFCKFFKLSIWMSCFRVLFGCNSTFEHPASLNSGKKWCGSIYLLNFGGNYSLYHKKFQNLNINKSSFCIFDGIRRNFNCRSIYKNFFYALNYIIYGVNAWLNKITILLYITVIKLISNIISNFYTYICPSCIFNS